MTNPQPAERLAIAVQVGAVGLYALKAVCELLIGTGWLHRDDFSGGEKRMLEIAASLVSHASVFGGLWLTSFRGRGLP